MRKLIIFLLPFFLYLFLLPILITAQRGGDPNADLTSIMSQGSVRSCLKRAPGGNESHPAAGGKMILTATLNLTGTCGSATGCEIWLHNTENDDIAVNEKILKNCKNGSTASYCDDTTHEEEELAKQVNVRPGWSQVTDFTVLGGGSTISPGVVAPGVVNISVSDRYAGHVSYSYYAIGDANAVAPTGNLGAGGGTVAVQQNNTQQLGTLDQSAVTPVPVVEGNSNNCVTLYWDPFGRVFDASSLEPMSGVDVTLLDNLGNPAVVDGPYANFDTTKVDNGVYNILVSKEADYQLRVDPPKTHLFTRNVNLQSNYSLVYSDIYLPGDIFHEAPMPETVPDNFDYSSYHHDIPLMPIGEPYRVDPFDVFVIKSSVRASDMGQFVNYSGKDTFPRAKVCLVGEENNDVIGDCVFAEKYGNFRLNVEKNKIPQEKLFLIAEKTDLTQPLIKSNNIDLSKVDFNNKDLLTFEPILNYIEGYVHDDNGQILPKATVTVKLKEGDLPFYSTQADDSGFFTIYGKNLPFAEYYLDVNGKIMTTSEFVKANRSYLNSEKLNLITSTRNDQPIINPATGQLNQQPLVKAPINKNVTAGPSGSSFFNPTAVVILAIILLLVGATIGLVLYIRKSKTI